MKVLSLIRPSTPITICTLTVPTSRNLLATSGYTGTGFESTLRPSCACKFATPRLSAIASNAPPRILPLHSFLISTFPFRLAFRNPLNAWICHAWDQLGTNLNATGNPLPSHPFRGTGVSLPKLLRGSREKPVDGSGRVPSGASAAIFQIFPSHPAPRVLFVHPV